MTNVLLSPSDVESDIAKRLQAIGVRTVAWPELSLVALEASGPLDEAIENLFGYDWVVLKNGAAAEFFLKRLQDLHRNIDELDDVRLCIIGDDTLERVREAQVHVDLPLDRFPVEAFSPAIASYPGGNASISGLNILVPCANITREVFEEELEFQGARVDVVATHRTTNDTQRLAQIKGLIRGGGIDLVLFSQPSAIEEFAKVGDTDNLPSLLAGAPVACLDQETMNTAVQFGLTSAVSPNEPSVDAFAELIIRLLARH